MRIGLCSGPAVVGNMGSKNRMDYTMMGDTVNTAARLEGVNKVYGTYTLISQTTYEGAKDHITARELDAINVVGKAVPVKIYELVGHKDKVDEKVMRTIGFYEQGLAAYRRWQWDAAIDFFHQALEIIEDDGPSMEMISRCRAYKENPPDPDWNGAYIMRTK
jgi:adenylate cyclase